jgi:hypothetical protein
MLSMETRNADAECHSKANCADCRHAGCNNEARYADWCYSECRYAECRGIDNH